MVFSPGLQSHVSQPLCDNRYPYSQRLAHIGIAHLKHSHVSQPFSSNIKPCSQAIGHIIEEHSGSAVKHNF